MQIQVDISSVTEDDYRDLCSLLGSGNNHMLLCRLLDLAGLYLAELERGAVIVCGNPVFYRAFGIGRRGDLPTAASRPHVRMFDVPDFPWKWRLRRLSARAGRLNLPDSTDSFVNLLIYWGYLSLIAVAYLGVDIGTLRPGTRSPLRIRYKHLDALRLQYLPRS